MLPTIRLTNPGDKVLQFLLVLYDSSDGVVFVIQVEGEEVDVFVGEPLNEVQPKHWRKAALRNRTKPG